MISERLRKRLAGAECVVAFTGAGISAESGVPTFRSNDGIWKKFKPEELASVNGFMRNPELVWHWYNERRKVIRSVQPNGGHRALAALEQSVPFVTVVTQNIDNLHQRAGSTRVFELHGNIERNYCMTCGTPLTDVESHLIDGIPHCQVERNGKVCSGLIRPDVVWFGEILPEDEWNGAVASMESADVVLSIGTSGVVFPAASLPHLAKKHGAFLVEVNPEPTPLTEFADEFLNGPAGTVLPLMVDEVFSLHNR
ncbi:MAG TPA: NAD-dependent deacylase [Bacteroidota bacterium]